MGVPCHFGILFTFRLMWPHDPQAIQTLAAAALHACMYDATVYRTTVRTVSFLVTRRTALREVARGVGVLRTV